MNQEIKIKKLLNWYMVILVVVLVFWLDISNVLAVNCEQAGGMCIPDVLNSCTGGNIIDKNFSCESLSVCCKPVSAVDNKTVPSGGGSVTIFGKSVDTDSLNGLVQVIVNIATWILGITGSLALAFFIYGGIMFMVSGGNSDRVNQAKQILIGAVIGLIIVFASYMIINFIFNSMGLKWEGKSVFPTAITK